MKQRLEDTVQEALDEQVELPSEHPSWQEVLGYAWKSYVPRTMRAVGRSLAKFGSPALKCLLYPLAGNLPAGIQRSLEERTQGWYDAESAAVTSIFTNLAFYPAMAASVAHATGTSDGGGVLAVAVALGYAFVEDMIRVHRLEKGKASLPGTLLALPLTLAMQGRNTLRGARTLYHRLEEEALRGRKD